MNIDDKYKQETQGFNRFKLLRGIIKTAINQGFVWGTTEKMFPQTNGMKLYHRDLKIFVPYKDTNSIAYELMCIPVSMYAKEPFKSK